MATATHAGMVMFQKQVIMDWMISQLQGSFVAKDFLPVTTTSNTSFKWGYNGAIGGVTPEAGENESGPMIHVSYRQNSAVTKDYRERTSISLRVKDISAVDVARDNINNLTDRLALRLETLSLGAIMTNAITTAPAHGFFWRDLSIGGRQWVNGVGAVSIIDDVIDAQKCISRYTRMRTDTILCGDEVAASIRKNVETKRWDRVGPMSVDLPKSGTMQGLDVPSTEGNESGQSERAKANIGNIAGHEIFVSNAVVLTNPDDQQSAVVPILDHDVYIFKRGPRLGRMVYYEFPQMLGKEPDVFARTQEWQISACLVPVVYRPQLIFTYRNAF